MSHGFIIRWSAHYKTTAQRALADLFLGMGKRVTVLVTLNTGAVRLRSILLRIFNKHC